MTSESHTSEPIPSETDHLPQGSVTHWIRSLPSHTPEPITSESHTGTDHFRVTHQNRSLPTHTQEPITSESHTGTDHFRVTHRNRSLPSHTPEPITFLNPFLRSLLRSDLENSVMSYRQDPGESDLASPTMNTSCTFLPTSTVSSAQPTSTCLSLCKHVKHVPAKSSLKELA